MFGYVVPDKPQLRMWEYEEYRAIYCGLCKSMGKHTGQLSRLTLNYDYVFLAMVRMAMLEITPDIVRGKCALHPIKKRLIAKDDKALEYCAKVSTILAYHKVLDNIADCRGAKKLMALVLKPVFATFLPKDKALEEVSEKIAGILCDMSELERAGCNLPDKLADCFGAVMSEIFSFGLEDEKKRRIARELGWHIGRYIYFADALEDIPQDIKNNEFNVFVTAYTKEEVLKHTDDIKTAVLLELTALEKVLALVDFSACPGCGNIVNNTIYLGVVQKTDGIIKKITQKSN